MLNEQLKSKFKQIVDRWNIKNQVNFAFLARFRIIIHQNRGFRVVPSEIFHGFLRKYLVSRPFAKRNHDSLNAKQQNEKHVMGNRRSFDRNNRIVFNIYRYEIIVKRVRFCFGRAICRRNEAVQSQLVQKTAGVDLSLLRRRLFNRRGIGGFRSRQLIQGRRGNHNYLLST